MEKKISFTLKFGIATKSYTDIEEMTWGEFLERDEGNIGNVFCVDEDGIRVLCKLSMAYCPEATVDAVILDKHTYVFSN